MKYIVDYDICTRATIMRRDQSKIKDIESLKTFIRYNNFTKDKLALNDSTASISARGDLLPKPECFGAYDAKVSSVSDLKGKTKTIYVIAGPTYSDEPEWTAFNWNDGACNAKFKHEGIKSDGPIKYDWFTVTNRFDA